MGNQRKHRQTRQRRPLITLSSIFVAAIIIVLLGAVSAVFGLGSAAFTGKFGSLQITTTSVGLVLVIAGFIFLYKMARLIPQEDFRLRFLIQSQQISPLSLLEDEPEPSDANIELSEIPEETNPAD